MLPPASSASSQAVLLHLPSVQLRALPQPVLELALPLVSVRALLLLVSAQKLALALVRAPVLGLALRLPYLQAFSQFPPETSCPPKPLLPVRSLPALVPVLVLVSVLLPAVRFPVRLEHKE